MPGMRAEKNGVGMTTTSLSFGRTGGVACGPRSGGGRRSCGPNSFTQSCNPIRDFTGADITAQFAAKIGPNCLEVPLTGSQLKEGAFDGGYAFADYCPNGYDMAADNGTCTGGSDPVPLVAGTYITHAIMPKDTADTRDCNPANTDGFKQVTDPA